MSEKNQPNVAADLIRIHAIVTRGLRVGIERSQAFAQDGFPDASTREGFVSYVQTLVAVLHGHHLAEDELGFPRLRERLPDVPYDTLMAEHQQMIPILGEIKDAAGRVAADPQVGPALTELKQALTKMSDLWHPHIQTEEDHFSVEVGAELFSIEEHIELGQAFAKHSQEHATGPDYLMVPFMLFNLSAEDRAILSQAMPPIITQELVPVAWKEKWAPMAPFLLD
jgi:hypothetical protein